MDPDLGVDPDPRWIRIQAIPIPDLLDAIPDPDPDPAKNGIVTPLEANHLVRLSRKCALILVERAPG